MESILDSIVKMLGNAGGYDPEYDQDIIIHINSVLAILYQLGVGKEAFRIEGEDETWLDFLGDYKDIDDVKSYVYLKVKMIYDPPASTAISEAYTRMINEFEWRINASVDFKGGK